MKTLLLLVVLLLQQHSFAQACSCPPRPGPALDTAQAIFLGKVIAIIADPITRSSKIQFSATRTWKGTIKEQIWLSTSPVGGLCGYPFEEGTTYLVYADERDGELTTNVCTRTKPESSAREDLKELEGANAK